MRSEHKRTTGLKDIVQNSTKPGDLAVDACPGTFTVVKASMLLRNHRTFLGCHVDPSCLTEEMSQLILLYARQQLSKMSDIDGEEEVRCCASVYVKAVEAIEVRKLLDVCEGPERILPGKTLTSHILYHLSNYFVEMELFQKARNAPANL